jgi:flavin-binding protein dodecin
MRHAQSVCNGVVKSPAVAKIRKSFDQTADGSSGELLTKGDIIMAKLVKVIEVLAQSEKSWDDAAQQALSEASKTLRNIRSVYVKEFEAAVENGKITQYRINAKISFDLEESRAGGS